MSTLARQRCLHHPERGAVARCPSCKTFFCRECVTEHEGRMICRVCLDRASRDEPRPARRRLNLFVALQCLLGIFVLWTYFYVIGRLLLAVPSDFHEGQVWKPILEETARER